MPTGPCTRIAAATALVVAGLLSTACAGDRAGAQEATTSHAGAVEQARDSDDGKGSQDLSYHPTRLLIGFEEGIDPERIRAFLESRDLRAKDHLERVDVFVVEIGDGSDPKALARRLEMEPEVRLAEPDYERRIRPPERDR